MQKKLEIVIITLFVLAIISGSIVQIIPVYLQKRKAEQVIKEKQQALEKVQDEYRSHMQEVHDLEHSPAAVEKVAREKFKYCRPGETIYIYSE